MKNNHLTYLTVRGYELDSYGHVNNAVYLQYYEQARWEMMQDRGVLEELRKSNVLLVVVESLVRYMRELSLFDELVVESKFEIKPPYLVFHQKIINKKDGLPSSRAKIKTIFIGEDKIPSDIPDLFRKSV